MAEKEKRKTPNAIQSFFRETTGELRKVSWPTRAEAWRLTGLVLAVMVVVGLSLFFVEEMAIQLLKLAVGS